jgi:ATP-dependent protease ClpP protease subunit
MIINILFKGCSINRLNRITLQFEICQAIRKNPRKINLLFATTGGEIYEAFLFYDFIKELNYPIDIYNIGEIRSAGTVMFLAFDNRYFLNNSKFLFHAVRLKSGVEQTAETRKQTSQFNSKMLTIFRERINLDETFYDTMTNTTDDIWIDNNQDISNYSIATYSTEKFTEPIINIPCNTN